MSRYTVEITNGTATDAQGTIGYDPPLRTFFLQGFPHPKTDECALWFGTLSWRNFRPWNRSSRHRENRDTKFVG